MSQAITARQLDDRAVLQYKADGFLIVRGLFSSDEISALDAEAERLYRLSDLIDTDNIRCRWQNHFQTPGAEGYRLHQDYIAWESFPTSFPTAIVAIDACDPENGATEVFRGYHLRGYMSPKDGMYHHLPDESVDALAGGRFDFSARRCRGLQWIYAAPFFSQGL